MAQKDVGLVYQNIVAGVMTGTNTITSKATNVIYKDTIGIELEWTGTPTGTFQFQGSLDYNPGLPQTGGTANAGNWVNIPVVDAAGNPIAASGTAGNALIKLDEAEYPWVQVVYTNSSGAGVLNGYIITKSLGS